MPGFQAADRSQGADRPLGSLDNCKLTMKTLEMARLFPLILFQILPSTPGRSSEPWQVPEDLDTLYTIDHVKTLGRHKMWPWSLMGPFSFLTLG